MAQNVDPHTEETAAAGAVARDVFDDEEDTKFDKDLTDDVLGPPPPDKRPVGAHSVSKRLQQELLSLMTCGDKGISAFPDTDYMFKWTGTIHGPDATVYEGLIYKLSMEFPSGYPYVPPTVRFVTRCFHPNVDLPSGTICLDILKEKWSALYDVRAILLSIQSLLAEPNNESPLNPHAADLWSNPEAYRKKLNDRSQAKTQTRRDGIVYMDFTPSSSSSS